MRNRILGGIGVLWGGAIVVRFFVARAPTGSSAYHAGQVGALIFGVLLVLVGLYFLVRPRRKADGSGADGPAA